METVEAHTAAVLIEYASLAPILLLVHATAVVSADNATAVVSADEDHMCARSLKECLADN